MKSVLISIKPKWCELIAIGKKTIEVRKTRPKLGTPFKCYIYETKGKSDVPVWMDEDGHASYKIGGKVIGEFVCDNIEKLEEFYLYPEFEFEQDVLQGFMKDVCMTYSDLCQYRKNLAYHKPLYCWHISDLIIYDEPKELGEFSKPILTTGLRYEDDIIKRAPQSWCYVEKIGR